MTNREKEILDLLRRDPLISQQELADKLGITRSSAAVHISKLMQKGAIRGKGYILSEVDRVTVLGGANIDIYGAPSAKLVAGVSNPGVVHSSCGGVGRNVAENLALLGESVSLITAMGKDVHGERLRQCAQDAGVDISRSVSSYRYPTSTYMALQDHNGEMVLAVSQMDVMEELTPAVLRKEEVWMDESAVLVLDANLPQESLRWMARRYRKQPLWIDPVSVEKSKKLTGILDAFHAIKPNRKEAAQLSGISAGSRDGVLANWRWFMEAGVKELWLSLGREGLFFGNGRHGIFARFPEREIRNANGAGDALMAGAVHATLAGEDDQGRIRMALAASVLACTSAETICPELSEAAVRKLMNEVNIYETIS